VHVVVSIAASVVWLAIGLQLGRTEGRPISGLLYALLGPTGLFFFWAGRERRRDRDAQRIEPRSI
jgi:hypothetical protein